MPFQELCTEDNGAVGWLTAMTLKSSDRPPETLQCELADGFHLDVGLDLRVQPLCDQSSEAGLGSPPKTFLATIIPVEAIIVENRHELRHAGPSLQNV
jgi:hypothetical protein